MRGIWFSVAMAAVLVLAVMACGQERQGKDAEKGAPVSFKSDVMPVLKRHCLPCHAEENFNPSELSLDSYSNLMAGGKHGVPVEAGKASESILVQKLGSNPPFGDKMPLIRKKDAAHPDKLTDQEIETITRWIDQGARDN
jgi:hypothetical protein